MPFGCCAERDNSIRRADSRVEAAITTTRPFASMAAPVAASRKATPRALPVPGSTVISRAMDPVRSVRRPVSRAG
jgi:hypothetical protein